MGNHFCCTLGIHHGMTPILISIGWRCLDEFTMLPYTNLTPHTPPASRHLLFNQIHIIFDKTQVEYITLSTQIPLFYRRRCYACLFIHFTRFIWHTLCISHPCMSVLCVHFIGPQGDLTVFVKLVIQQVAMKGVRTIFGLNFTCLREREVGGK